MQNQKGQTNAGLIAPAVIGAVGAIGAAWVATSSSKAELGYFRFSELDTALAPRGLALVERDIHFVPETLPVLKSRHLKG